MQKWLPKLRVIRGKEARVTSLHFVGLRAERVWFSSGLIFYQFSYGDYKKGFFLLRVPLGKYIPATFLSTSKFIKRISKRWRLGIPRKRPYIVELMLGGENAIRRERRFSKGRRAIS